MGILRVGRHTVIPPLTQVRTFAPRTVAAAAGWWVVSGKTCMAAYAPKGAASYAAALANLDNPGTNDAIDGVNVPTWDAATGWTFVAANIDALRTNIDGAQKPVSIMARVTVLNSAGYRTILGTYDAMGWQLRIDDGSNKQTFNHEGTAGVGTSTTGISGTASVGITYSAAGAFSFYLDGSADGSGTVNRTATAGAKFVIGDNAYASEFFNGNILALAIYADTLTAGEVAALHGRMAAL